MRLYGLPGIAFVRRALVAQALVVMFALIAVVVRPFLPAVSNVAFVLALAACLALIGMLWSGLAELFVRLDLNRLRTRLQSQVLPIVAGFLLLATIVALLTGVIGPPIAAATALVLGIPALVASVLAIRGIGQHLARRQAFHQSWQESAVEVFGKNGDAWPVRIQEFIARESGGYGPVGHSPVIKGYHYPGLETRCTHPNDRFDWIPRLRQEFPKIREEGVRALDELRERFAAYPEVGNQRWRSFALYKGGKRIADNCGCCPETARLLESVVPGGTAREAMFAWLEPGGYLQPHIDNAIPMLTCHLGLVTPEQCAIRIGDEEHAWTEGEFLVIDTTYEHEAWNRGTGSRLILLFDFWPPDLGEDERRYFGRIFAKQMAAQAS